MDNGTFFNMFTESFTRKVFYGRT